MRRISEGEFGIRQPDYLEQLNSQNVKQTIDATAPCAPPAPWSDPGPVLETRCRADRSFPSPLTPSIGLTSVVWGCPHAPFPTQNPSRGRWPWSYLLSHGDKKKCRATNIGGLAIAGASCGGCAAGVTVMAALCALHSPPFWDLRCVGCAGLCASALCKLMQVRCRQLSNRGYAHAPPYHGED